MKDLSVINNLDQVLDSGVSSLKIEGRMKSLEYVQTIVTLYRKKIDEYYLKSFTPITSQEDKMVKVTFNRGFTKGYLLKDLNINRTDYNNVNHQGILIGKVISKNNKKITIKLSEDLSFNDGIRFKGNNEYGAYVNEMYFNNKLVKYVPKNNIVTLVLNTPCNVGDNVYKTVDINLQNEAKELLKNFPLKTNIHINVNIKLNEPLSIELIYNNQKVKYEHVILKEVAKTPLTIERIKQQLLKLNDTLFSCSKIDVIYDNKAFFSIKDLNELRRIGISKLEEVLINNVERNKSLSPIGSFNTKTYDIIY
jgi:putative protease